jgi:hypothetical protein
MGHAAFDFRAMPGGTAWTARSTARQIAESKRHSPQAATLKAGGASNEQKHYLPLAESARPLKFNLS